MKFSCFLGTFANVPRPPPPPDPPKVAHWHPRSWELGQTILSICLLGLPNCVVTIQWHLRVDQCHAVEIKASFDKPTHADTAISPQWCQGVWTKELTCSNQTIGYFIWNSMFWLVGWVSKLPATSSSGLSRCGHNAKSPFGRAHFPTDPAAQGGRNVLKKAVTRFQRG